MFAGNGTTTVTGAVTADKITVAEGEASHIVNRYVQNSASAVT